MSDVQTWSATAASNNAPPPNGWPEGMNYSDVNDAARENMAAIKRWYEDIAGTLTTTGAADAYVLTPNRTIAAYADGLTFVVKIHATNTGASEINVSSLGAVDILSPAGVALEAGQLQAGRVYTLRCDGTNFVASVLDSAEVLAIVQGDSSWHASNWDTAYSWGNHASAGYAVAANIATVNGNSLTSGGDVDTITETTASSSGNSFTLTKTGGTIKAWEATGNFTISDSLSNGQSLTLAITRTGSYTATWPTITWKTFDGNAPEWETGVTFIVIAKIAGTLYGWGANG